MRLMRRPPTPIMVAPQPVSDHVRRLYMPGQPQPKDAPYNWQLDVEDDQ